MSRRNEDRATSTLAPSAERGTDIADYLRPEHATQDDIPEMPHHHHMAAPADMESPRYHPTPPLCRLLVLYPIASAVARHIYAPDVVRLAVSASAVYRSLRPADWQGLVQRSMPCSANNTGAQTSDGAMVYAGSRQRCLFCARRVCHVPSRLDRPRPCCATAFRCQPYRVGGLEAREVARHPVLYVCDDCLAPRVPPSLRPPGEGAPLSSNSHIYTVPFYVGAIWHQHPQAPSAAAPAADVTVLELEERACQAYHDALGPMEDPDADVGAWRAQQAVLRERHAFDMRRARAMRDGRRGHACEDGHACLAGAPCGRSEAAAGPSGG
ncbi:MAG: hypothetical protein M1832_006383 [Thelocarpon impressellum]|nr:MAG: hypothetical protein M1832_006383 [Thelocarpon impressellum]